MTHQITEIITRNLPHLTNVAVEAEADLRLTPKAIPQNITPTLLSRLWRKVSEDKENGCWKWLGAKSSSKQPNARYDGVNFNPLYLMIKEIKGITPLKDHTVEHICGDALCINPDHKKILSTLQRFEEKYSVCQETGCWEWTGCRNSDGYGSFRYLSKRMSASRASLLIFAGQPPKATNMACHTCDNRGCVNPSHLYWGTQTTNMRDAASRGRLWMQKVATKSETVLATEKRRK